MPVDGGLDVTLTVSVLVSVPPAGSKPVDGLNFQVTPAATVGQLKVNCSLYPFWELNVTLKFAEPPTEIVAELGATDPLAPPTWMVTAGALRVTPSAVPKNVTE